MLVEILILLGSCGLSSTFETLSQPLHVKNLKNNLRNSKSSNDPTLPVIDLPERRFPLSRNSNCKKPVSECLTSNEDVTCYGTKLPYSSSGRVVTGFLGTIWFESLINLRIYCRGKTNNVTCFF